MLTENQILTRTLEVIKRKYTHKWYGRTVQLASDLTAYITGEGLDEMLQQFVRREDKDSFDQRVQHTQHIIPSVAKTLMDVSYKVPRSNGMKRILEYPENKDKLTELQSIMDKFWGNSSWDDYMAVRFIELNYIDPNSFIMFEWGKFNNETENAQPFPFEVSSKMAVDYWYANKVLQYLIVKSSITDLPTNDEEDLDRHTLYLKNQTLTFDKIDFQQPNEKEDDFLVRILTEHGIVEEGMQTVFIPKAGELKILLGANVYLVTYLVPHNLGKVPGFQVGFVPDLYTKREMYLNPFNAAIPYMRKMIKVVSEMDLSMSLHAMPQKIAYQNPCTDCAGSGQSKKGNCPTCKGMGFQIVTSANDAITLKMPPNATPDQLADLTKLVHYVYPPVDGLEFQDKYVHSLTIDSFKAVYGNQAVSKDQVTTTATESLLDDSKTYDALHPLTMMYSKSWMFGTRLIAQITDLEAEKMIVQMQFSKDLKFLNKEDYIKQLKDLQDAGSSEESKRIVNNEIVRLDYSESPLQMSRYQTKEFFMPFSGKNQDETILIIGALPRLNESKVLWMFFDAIFKKIELDKGIVFYELNRDMQAPIIKAEVDLIVLELSKQQEAEQPKVFIDEEIEDDDTE